MNLQSALTGISQSQLPSVLSNVSDDVLKELIENYSQYFQNINNLHLLFEMNPDLPFFNSERTHLPTTVQDPLDLQALDRVTLEDLLKSFIFNITQYGIHFYHLHQLTELLKQGKVNPQERPYSALASMFQANPKSDYLKSFKKETLQEVASIISVITQHLQLVNQHLKINKEACPTIAIPSMEQVFLTAKKSPATTERSNLEEFIRSGLAGMNTLHHVTLKFVDLCNNAISGVPFQANFKVVDDPTAEHISH